VHDAHSAKASGNAKSDGLRSIRHGKNRSIRHLAIFAIILATASACTLSELEPIGSAVPGTYDLLSGEALSEKGIVVFDGETYYMGLIPESDEEYESYPKMTMTSRATLPASIDLSAKLPNVGNQGQQGSCTAWATGYAYKTYQEGIDRGWNVKNDTTHQFSPAYIYNQINGGQDNGSQINTALQLIVDQGCATLSSMPYNQNDYRTQPNSAQRQNAAQYKAKKWWALTAGDVMAIKTNLANGDLVVVGIPVYPDFNVSSSNPIYDNTNGTLQGYHAIAFCGYDDSKQAFKLINSWGTNWGFSGYGWMSYNLISKLGIRA
jgi:C1A family cysteine protease